MPVLGRLLYPQQFDRIFTKVFIFKASSLHQDFTNLIYFFFKRNIFRIHKTNIVFAFSTIERLQDNQTGQK